MKKHMENETEARPMPGYRDCNVWASIIATIA